MRLKPLFTVVPAVALIVLAACEPKAPPATPSDSTATDTTPAFVNDSTATDTTPAAIVDTSKH